VVGVAKVVRTAYADPTADEGDWSAVDVAPVKALKEPVSLETIRADPKLAEMLLLRRSRLSVVPVTPAEFNRVLELGKTKL
jgi:predicted RNA-binding protein with PUA-like domain